MNDNIGLMMQFTKILKDEPNKAYDFISTEFMNFTKTDLSNIIKELLYSLHYHLDNSYGETLYNQIIRDVQIELDDQYEEAYEEYNKEFEKWEREVMKNENN